MNSRHDRWPSQKVWDSAGAYLGGVHNIKDVLAIREKAKSYGPDDWKEFYREMSFPQPGEFYLYKKNGSGLALPELTEGMSNRKKQPPRSCEGSVLNRLFIA